MFTAVLLIALFFVLSPFAPLGEGEASAASRTSLNNQLENNRSQLEKVRDNIAKAKAAQEAALGDIAALDQNIDALETEVRVATAAYDEAADKLAGLRDELDAVTINLNQKRDELSRTEKDLQTQQEAFNERLVNIYKSGGKAVYLAALLEPASFSELLGRFDLLSVVAEQDYTILTQIAALKAKVESQKAALEIERTRVSSLEQGQRAATETLQAKADRKQAALDELEDAKSAKEKVLAAAEKDEAAWSKQEDKLLAESDQIAAQLKAAQAASSESQTPAASEAGSGQFYRPVPGAVTSAFGYRVHPIFHVRKMHTGVDMHASMGTPIHAAAAGTVISAGWRGGYGKCVVISHGGNLATLYAHQSTLLVSAGQHVTRGQVIGEVGSTGYSTGAHLHFEVRVGGSPVNPMGYL